jgi:hypothetical protein
VRFGRFFYTAIAVSSENYGAKYNRNFFIVRQDTIPDNTASAFIRKSDSSTFILRSERLILILHGSDFFSYHSDFS